MSLFSSALQTNHSTRLKTFRTDNSDNCYDLYTHLKASLRMIIIIIFLLPKGTFRQCCLLYKDVIG